MKLLIRHQTVYRYAQLAGRVAMRLKLMPVDTPQQKVREWRVSINDEPVTGFHLNGNGEKEGVWICHGQIDHVTVVAEGLAETTETHGVLGWPSGQVDPRYFLRDTPLTRASDGIRDLALSVAQQGAPLDQLHALSAAIREAVSYRSGVTAADTAAAEAFALGAGVCQDHAQIFIAGARALGMPARYVSGYLLAEEDHALHETHGWAEALVPDLGWVGFDPSNQVCVTESYLRVASGLDADAAAPIRGSVTLTGDMWIDADVRIAQAEEGLEARQLQQQQQQSARSSILKR
ncbi:transglutaminase family protein [Sphingobium baderi]|uniref:Transglutaminase n=1 Tax=Sphingobium baderi TaxID=1332080 RepID=A0A0S3F1J5_9SPHN|nr:transglutaminase family protein [Sphingobium baderi]ALR21569.1 transglutaminase [Sphingobium baderi]